jgi:hypothetical protein
MSTTMMLVSENRGETVTHSGQEESFWRYFSQAFEDYQEGISRIQRVSPA